MTAAVRNAVLRQRGATIDENEGNVMSKRWLENRPSKYIAIYALAYNIIVVATVLLGVSVAVKSTAGIWATTILLMLVGSVGIIALDRRSTKASVRLDSRLNSVETLSIETNQRLHRLNPIIQNTAGSIGRAAPVVRANNELLKKLDLVEFDRQQDLPLTSTGGDPLRTTLPKSQESKNPLQLPPIPVRERPRAKRDLNVMVIGDEFTLKSFEYEWNQFEPTPETWRNLLDEVQIDFLLVESAWEGNGGSWRYQFTGQSAPRPAIVDLIDACRLATIPTVFWNKEDPPHYDDFIDTAKLFDVIFTTDANMLEKYRVDAPTSTVGVLAFAAQPALHNPARVAGVNRTGNIVFGGMYFRHKYPERRRQMDYILPAASEFGLDIYSRQLGGEEKYQFPDIVNDKVVGSLSYSEMVTAYHKYQTVINVNSVVDSPSMCARRIFEATASGAAVVTSRSPAVASFYPDGLITEVDDLDSARVAFKTLSRSDEYRERKVHLAQRHTWEHHTYSERVEQIVGAVGLPVERAHKTVSVVSPTNRPYMIGNIIENYSRQAYSEKELIVLTHGFEVGDVVWNNLLDKYDMSRVRVVKAGASASLGTNLNSLVELSDGSIISRMDDDDWYGENYLRDMVNSLSVSGAELAGKAASYIYFESRGETILTYSAKENVFSDFVRGASTVAYRDLLSEYPFHDGNRSEDSDLLSRLIRDGIPVYAGDRFNFSVFRSANAAAHTWREDDSILYSTGELKYMGRALDQISI